MAIEACNVGQITGIDDQIRDIQAQIADKIVLRSTKYESYWADFQTRQETELTRLRNERTTAVGELQASNTAVFPVEFIAGTPIARRMLRRELASL